MKKTGRYHNDYSPRYTEAQKKKERLRSLSIIKQEHGNRSCDDNSVSDKAPQIRNLSKEEKTKDCGENNL